MLEKTTELLQLRLHNSPQKSIWVYFHKFMIRFVTGRLLCAETLIIVLPQYWYQFKIFFLFLCKYFWSPHAFRIPKEKENSAQKDEGRMSAQNFCEWQSSLHVIITFRSINFTRMNSDECWKQLLHNGQEKIFNFSFSIY